MAEGGGSTSPGPQRPSVTESDVSYECDPCKMDDTVSDGIGFCTVCREYLCDNCIRGHRRYRALRNHDILTGADLHQAGSRWSKLPFEFCLHHPDTPVDVYCEEHDTVFSVACKKMDHQHCKRVRLIDDACIGLKDSETVKDFSKKLASLIRKAEELQINRAEDLKNQTQQTKSALDDLTNLRAELNLLLDKLELEMRRKIDDASKKASRQVSDHLSTLDPSINSLRAAEANLRDATDAGDRQTFISLKKIDLEKLETLLATLEANQQQTTIQFTTNKMLDDLLTGLQCIGRLQVHACMHPSTRCLPQDLLNMKVEKQSDRNVKESDDKETSGISSCVFLADALCLLCDFNNCKLKLLDRDLVLKTSVKMKGKPWDLAVLNTEEVIVSLSHEKEIQFVEVVPAIRPTRTIRLDKKCWGLAVHANQVLVTCHHNPGEGEVLVLDIDGTILKRIGKTMDGAFMFLHNLRLTVNADGDKLYVSDDPRDDAGSRHVACIDRDGGSVFTYSGIRPGHVALDKAGRVFVCDWTANRILVLTPDGKKHGDWLTKSSGLCQPLCFTFRPGDGTMVVGSHSSNTLQVFRFQ